MQRGWRIIWLWAVLILLGRGAWADAVPAKNQALLLLRILAYDHNLASRTTGGHVTIVLLYKPGNGDSEDSANNMNAILQDIGKSTTIANNSISVVRLPYTDKTFDADIARSHGAAVYVASGLGDGIGTITSATQAHKLLTFCGVPDFVSAGVAVGFGVDDGKPQILVNLPASRNEGADLDAALLHLAKIVKK